MRTESQEAASPEQKKPRLERRAHTRHTLNTSANSILIKTGTVLRGRVVDLSLGGCRIRLDARFDLGIFIRVETEFYLKGVALRIGGVSQTILDQNTIGIRFLDLSDRRRRQLSDLIAELAASPDHDPTP